MTRSLDCRCRSSCKSLLERDELKEMEIKQKKPSVTSTSNHDDFRRSGAQLEYRPAHLQNPFNTTKTLLTKLIDWSDKLYSLFRKIGIVVAPLHFDVWVVFSSSSVSMPSSFWESDALELLPPLILRLFAPTISTNLILPGVGETSKLVKCLFFALGSRTTGACSKLTVVFLAVVLLFVFSLRPNGRGGGAAGGAVCDCSACVCVPQRRSTLQLLH